MTAGAVNGCAPQPDENLTPIPLGAAAITPSQIALVANGGGRLVAGDTLLEELRASRAVIEHALMRGLPSYGANRGLGPARDQPIPQDLQDAFQEFVIASHAAGVGETLSAAQSRAVLAARVAGLARAGSGISLATFGGLLDLLDSGIAPVLTRYSSVGSGDLAPLASIGAVLIGRGLADTRTGRVSGATALTMAGLQPTRLRPKDALAIIGANSASLGVASLASCTLDSLVLASDLVAATTVEALGASAAPFHEMVAVARPLPGQIASAAAVRDALDGGDVAACTLEPESLQDALSIRTVPQVHGVLHQAADELRQTLTIELNSATENPVVDIAADLVRPNGNFSVLRLAVTLESTRLVLAHVGMLAERRIAILVQRARSGRRLEDQVRSAAASDRFLTPVLLSNTASQLVVRLKHLANPLSTAGTTVGDGVEDHSSNAYAAALATLESIEAMQVMLAIETLLACSEISGLSDPTRTLGHKVAGLHRVVEQTLAAFDRAATTNEVIDAIRPLLALAATTDESQDLRDATWHSEQENLPSSLSGDIGHDAASLREHLRGRP